MHEFEVEVEQMVEAMKEMQMRWKTSRLNFEYQFRLSELGSNQAQIQNMATSKNETFFEKEIKD